MSNANYAGEIQLPSVILIANLSRCAHRGVQQRDRVGVDKAGSAPAPAPAPTRAAVRLNNIETRNVLNFIKFHSCGRT